MFFPLLFAFVIQLPQQPPKQPIKVLSIMGKTLSMGGPLKFDEMGIYFVGEENSTRDKVDSYDGIDFRINSEYWKMLKKTELKLMLFRILK